MQLIFNWTHVIMITHYVVQVQSQRRLAQHRNVSLSISVWRLFAFFQAVWRKSPLWLEKGWKKPLTGFFQFFPTKRPLSKKPPKFCSSFHTLDFFLAPLLFRPGFYFMGAIYGPFLPKIYLVFYCFFGWGKTGENFLVISGCHKDLEI